MKDLLPVRRTRASSPPTSSIRLATRQVGLGRALAVAFVLLAVAAAVGLSLGAAGLPPSTVWRVIVGHIPLVPHPRVDAVDEAIVWQIRAPRVVLAAIVGAMLAGGGATYQGVFRNPLADPYLLGVAAGGGLGATAIIVSGGSSELLPVAAFVGAVAAVAVTYALGSTAKWDTGVGSAAVGNTSIVLAGVAVAAMFTAMQTYLQQQHVATIQEVYGWILGQLTLASWSDVGTVAPYAAVAAIVLVAGAARLDVLRVGEEEASTLGIDPARLRLVLIGAATLGTAAAVAVSGLIGFVGIIVPHTVRLTTSSSYRVLLPVSMVTGAAFLILADVAARTIQAPAEIPLGVVTAMVGAPFFLYVLRSRRAREALS
jgi:iron complex transport system permease protein